MGVSIFRGQFTTSTRGRSSEQRRPWCRKLPAPDAGAPGTTGTPAAKEPAADAPPPLDDELCSALKQALEDLFADQAVVTMRDVRLWLQSYTANVKARTAALQTDSTLASLLLGGGSVVEIRCVPCGYNPFD